ncbi:MAG: peptide chain release factor N(5)-glutamine methyltransferase [Chlamydiae bacterium]|nr:peptide chain release factor N(5)-glutamine methyltransferase [Chlamydiota bacterium]MBI3266037.1 peptide chain release factor N(5)-glutamine methyltransferase [Chlamydiota bacterium]
MMTLETLFIHDLLQDMIEILKKARIEEATQNAELILQEILGLKNRSEIYLNRQQPVSESSAEQALALVHQRTTGSPLQYLLGHTEFFGLKMLVNRYCLIPRFETEMLVEKALYWFQKNPGRSRILDIGTGSGNIAIALAKNIPQADILAIDISENALKVAEENTRIHGVQSQIKLETCNFEKFIPSEPFDMVIANPPYIPEEEWENLQAEVLLEPRTALLGGEKGLKILNQIIERTPLFLKSNGVLLMEFGGEHQTSALLKKLSEKGFRNINFSKDLAGKDRVVEAIW